MIASFLSLKLKQKCRMAGLFVNKNATDHPIKQNRQFLASVMIISNMCEKWLTKIATSFIILGKIFETNALYEYQ